MLQNNNSSWLNLFYEVANRITDVSNSPCNYPPINLFVLKKPVLKIPISTRRLFRKINEQLIILILFIKKISQINLYKLQGV